MHSVLVTNSRLITEDYYTYLADQAAITTNLDNPLLLALIECLSKLSIDRNRNVSVAQMKVPKNCFKLTLNPKFRCDKCSLFFTKLRLHNCITRVRDYQWPTIGH